MPRTKWREDPKKSVPAVCSAGYSKESLSEAIGFHTIFTQIILDKRGGIRYDEYRCKGNPLYTRRRKESGMKNQAYRMAMLFDFYGDLLTDRQREFYDLYYNDDLSLAEIAENYGITRQGVRDNIVRAERALEEIEEKTGLIRRYRRTRSTIAALQDICDSLQSVNQDRLHDKETEALCLRLQEAIDDLGRE